MAFFFPIVLLTVFPLLLLPLLLLLLVLVLLPFARSWLIPFMLLTVPWLVGELVHEELGVGVFILASTAASFSGVVLQFKNYAKYEARVSLLLFEKPFLCLSAR